MTLLRIRVGDCVVPVASRSSPRPRGYRRVWRFGGDQRDRLFLQPAVAALRPIGHVWVNPSTRPLPGREPDGLIAAALNSGMGAAGLEPATSDMSSRRSPN
jgi:hypothetical protein